MKALSLLTFFWFYFAKLDFLYHGAREVLKQLLSLCSEVAKR